MVFAVGAFDYALKSETGPFGEIVSHGFNGPNLASTTIGSWTESILRDTALRPYSFTSPAGSFTYTFNGGGRQPATLAGPGTTTTFSYNASGWPRNIAVNLPGQHLVDDHTYSYLANGWISQIQRINHVTAKYTHDSIGQLTTAQALEPDGVTVRKNENLGFTYDPAHNLFARTNNAQVQFFNCDALDQLASITRSGPMTVLGSFTGSNIVSMGVNGTNAEVYSDGTFASATGLIVHDGNNLFVTAGTNNAGELALSTATSSHLLSSNSFSFDLNGHILSDGQRSFEWDDADRLTAVSALHRWRTEFAYDAFSRRRIVREYSWNLNHSGLDSEPSCASRSIEE
ncbi:MAG: hypothetical protein C5B50_17970 [Verrucomicrobia bacterium]|nr:MAG: hypothetical protein C5B50_17970 [Verrucomicrobiota bacterium]